MMGESHKMPRVSGAEREARERIRDDRRPMADERPQPGRGMDERRIPSGDRPGTMGGELHRQDNHVPEQHSMPEPPPPPESKLQRMKKSIRKKSGCCLFSLIGILVVMASGIMLVL